MNVPFFQALSPSSMATRTGSIEDGVAYLRSHGIPRILDALVQDLIKETPTDPLQHIAAWSLRALVDRPARPEGKGEGFFAALAGVLQCSAALSQTGPAQACQRFLDRYLEGPGPMLRDSVGRATAATAADLRGMAALKAVTAVTAATALATPGENAEDQPAPATGGAGRVGDGLTAPASLFTALERFYPVEYTPAESMEDFLPALAPSRIDEKRVAGLLSD